MYYIYTDTVYPAALKSLIDQLLKLDSKEDIPFTEELCDDTQSSKPKKCRKYCTHILKVTPEILCNRMGVNVYKVQNSTHRNNHLYNTFKQQLVTYGTIQWRQHNDYQDTVIMSDYNPAEAIVLCTCHMHNQ